ncbi:MAG TPA: DNA polymerase I, partial [Hyphomicrobiales bacterium]|nr:DNA polymerase I [Hyphomicrobiales bacterium]
MPSPSLKAGDHLVLVDGSSYIFRAYHALPPLTRTSDGLPVGAIAGFCNMLWKFLRDGMTPAPTHLAVIFDKSEHTFRNEIYPQYKAQRPDAPDDLRPQFRLIRDAVRAFQVACVEQDGYEADDLIATYAELAAAAGAETTIVGSDKDLMQLVRDGVAMLDPVKQSRIGRAEVIEKFGVPPERVIDAQSLAGDSVDNVPGVPGIGLKTAAQLLIEYGDLETLLFRAGEIKQPKRRENLIQFADQARISKRLVTLDRTVPLLTEPGDLVVQTPEPHRLVSFLKAMEFTTLVRRVCEATGIDPAEVEADPALRAGSVFARKEMPGDGAEPAPPAAADGQAPHPPAPAMPRRPEGGANGALTPAGLAAARAAEALASPCERSNDEIIRTLDRLDAWIAAAYDVGVLAIDLHASGADPMQAEIVGLSLALAPGRAAYVPLAHTTGGDLLGGGRAPDQIEVAAALAALKPALETVSVLKIGHDLKFEAQLLLGHDIRLRGFDDIMLISYALDSGRGSHGLTELASRHLGHACIGFDSLTGTGRQRVPFAEVAIDRAAPYGAESADIALRLWRALKPRLTAEGMTRVYERLERPLVPVLAHMERRGIAIDRQMLSRLSGDFAQSMGRLEDEIFTLAGEEFNLGSPKQLGDILFGKMGLPGGSKTKTGAWSTGAQVLDELAEAGHALPRKILDWRQVSKLKSTYTDALPGYIHPETRRVHTSFALASTSTGRLSSQEPNIQNIPVRTEEGRKIRKAFVATEGH